MSSIEKEIRKIKERLIEKAKREGLYENFGQKEIRMLEDKFIDSSDYSREMNKRRKRLSEFREWCESFGYPF